LAWAGQREKGEEEEEEAAAEAVLVAAASHMLKQHLTQQPCTQSPLALRWQEAPSARLPLQGRLWFKKLWLLLLLLLLLVSSVLRLEVALVVVLAFLEAEEGGEEAGGERAEGEEEAARFCRSFPPPSPLAAEARATAADEEGEPCDRDAACAAVLACFLPLLRVAERGGAGEAEEAPRRGGRGEGGGGGEVVEEGEDLAMLRWDTC